MTICIHEALLQRFKIDLASLWQPGEKRLGLAVSGGPDSLALLLLAAATFPDAVEAATVDHSLRAESAAEALEVGRVCATLNIPHHIATVHVAEGNVQAQAREARYAALASWMAMRNLTALSTGHHADDQAETLVMRLNRGSGVAGLAGTRARGLVPHTDFPLIRPLLHWRRAELAAIVEGAGFRPALDPSNDDPRYDRVRVRQALKEADWLDVLALAESASHLSEADAAIEWAARREWAENVSREAMAVVYRPHAPRAIALRVLTRIVMELSGKEPRGSAIARLFEALVGRESASIGDLVVRPSLNGWTFMKAPRRASARSVV